MVIYKLLLDAYLELLAADIMRLEYQQTLDKTVYHTEAGTALQRR